MDWLFDALDIESTKGNRKRIDAAIRDELRLGDDAHCPQVWAAIKALDSDGRMELIPALQSRLD